jgi:hypothetical protein
MARAKLKTQRNDRSVHRFLSSIKDETTRKDCFTILTMMKQITKKDPEMWGTSIVGFGSYKYRYDSGREGEAPLSGFSPRKQNLTLYVMAGFTGYPELMQKLGKNSTGKSCLYVKRLEDVHLPTLRKIIQRSVRHMARLRA